MTGIPTTMVCILSLLAGQQVVCGTASIVLDSPFLPPNFNPPGNDASTTGMPASSNQFKFRGVYQLSDVYYYNLYNEREMTSSWISSDSVQQGFPRVIGYSETDNQLMVEYAGEVIRLEMIQGGNLPFKSSKRTKGESGTGPSTVMKTAQPTRRMVIRQTDSTREEAAPLRRLTIPQQPQGT